MTIVSTQIDKLYSGAVDMADVCLTHLESVSVAFLTGNMELARKIEDTQEHYQEVFDELEESMLKLLALHHPVASDLKRVIHIFKLGQDLERTHTYVYRIAKKTRKMAGDHVQLDQSFKMQFTLVTNMLRLVIGYLKDGSGAPFAAELEKQQQECSRVKREIKTQVELELAEKAANPSQVLLVQGVARHLDKISKILVDMWIEIAEYTNLRHS